METFRQEWKRKLTPDTRKEIVAFANSQGGVLSIGIDDDGTVIGVADPVLCTRQIHDSVRDAIRPDLTLFVHISVVKVEGKDVVRVEVQRGTKRPYYITEKGLRPSGVYVRQGTSSVPASEDAIRAMIKESDGDRFETERSMLQELTFQEAAAVFKERGVLFGEAQLRSLGLRNEDDLWTNLALLLSDQCPISTKAALFEGTTKRIFKDRQEFTGSVLRQFRESFAYLDRLNRTRSTFPGAYRVDHRDYPEEAIRESLLNALAHRDYALGSSTMLAIFDDRIEILSLGGLIQGLSMEDVLFGVSKSRNDGLSRVLYRLNLVEAFGTGVSRMLESYAEDVSKPELMATSGAFRVVLPNRNHVAGKNAREGEYLFGEGGGRHLLRDAESYETAPVRGFLAAHEQLTRKDVETLFGVKQSRAAEIVARLVQEGILVAVRRGNKTEYKARKG